MKYFQMQRLYYIEICVIYLHKLTVSSRIRRPFSPNTFCVRVAMIMISVLVGVTRTSTPEYPSSASSRVKNSLSSALNTPSATNQRNKNIFEILLELHLKAIFSFIFSCKVSFYYSKILKRYLAFELRSFRFFDIEDC